MKVVRFKESVKDDKYNFKIAIVTKREMEKFESDAEQFYKQFGSDLDMRVEPFEVDNKKC